MEWVLLREGGIAAVGVTDWKCRRGKEITGRENGAKKGKGEVSSLERGNK